MNKLKICNPDKREITIKTGRLEDACARYNFGRATMRKIAEDAGAVVRVGRCYRVNFTKVDEYLDAIAE